MRTPAGRVPRNASAITASQAPYIGAVSIRLMPAVRAAWTVATACSSLDAPHACPIPPPPSVKRLTSANGPSCEYRIEVAVASDSVGAVADDCDALHNATVRKEVVAHAVLGGPVVPERDAARTPTKTALNIGNRRHPLEGVQERSGVDFVHVLDATRERSIHEDRSAPR